MRCSCRGPSIQLERPVKFLEDRIEHFIGSTHERKQIHEIDVAASADGVVLGLRDRFLHDTGAYIPYGIAIAQVAATQLPGPYRVPSFSVEFTAVYTNTVPVTPYRGCGRPQACMVIERVMDRLASEVGVDRAEIRRRNYIQPDEFPYRRGDIVFADGLPVTLDSGQYEKQLDTLLDAIGWEGFAAEQAAARAEGRYIGLGLANYVEGTGLGPYEGAHVQVEPTTGKVWGRDRPDLDRPGSRDLARAGCGRGARCRGERRTRRHRRHAGDAVGRGDLRLSSGRREWQRGSSRSERGSRQGARVRLEHARDGRR